MSLPPPVPDLVPPRSSGVRTMLDQLLEEQRQLPAVERFSAWHDRTAAAPGSRYAALLPAAAPKPGQQYAFEVDLDACTGCKACVAACHSLNGLEEHETWRSAGLLVSPERHRPHRQTVTTACHHCVDPGCASGCPVLAYEKDETTGIVRHLDDQCIGCSYCTMTCSYGVPQYLPSRGIVRKCDMCRQRLDAGEAPACVQACPNGAIRIVLTDQTELRNASRAEAAALLPGAPPSRITIPSTRFVSRHPVPASLVPETTSLSTPQPAHRPLVAMLVLSQAGVGTLTTAIMLDSTSCLAAAAVLAVAGNAAAVLHLGRPMKAWRAWLGWRTSWLSREIIAFGLHLGPVLLLTLTSLLSIPLPGRAITEAVALGAGVAGIICSGMVYHVTQRPAWSGARSWLRFLLTAVLAGAAAAWAAGSSAITAAALGVAALAKLTAELRWQRIGLACDPGTPAGASSELMEHRFGFLWRLRLTLLVLGGMVLPFLAGIGGAPASAAAAGVLLLLAGEGIERLLFFRTGLPWQMPGWVTRPCP